MQRAGTGCLSDKTGVEWNQNLPELDFHRKLRLFTTSISLAQGALRMGQGLKTWGLPASPASPGSERRAQLLQALQVGPRFSFQAGKWMAGFLHHSLTVTDYLGTLLKNTACLGTLFWPSPAHGPAFITKGLEINTICPARRECPLLAGPTIPRKSRTMQTRLPSPILGSLCILIFPCSSALRPSLFYPNNIYRGLFPLHFKCNVPHNKFQKYRKGKTEINLELG